MSKYEQVAINAVGHIKKNPALRPRDAWAKAAAEIFSDSPSSRDKGCPRTAFLALCEAGHINGVPSGTYAPQATDNKRYTIDAFKLLQKHPALTAKELWRRVAPSGKTPNHQMDVLLALRDGGFLA